MAKKKLSTVNFLMLAGIGIGAYFLFSSFTKATQLPAPAPTPTPSPTPTPTPLPSTGCNPTVTYRPEGSKIMRALFMWKGMDNSYSKDTVAYLQAWLNQKYNTCLNIDGDFGTLTETALFDKTGKKEASLDQLNAVYQFGQGGALG